MDADPPSPSGRCAPRRRAGRRDILSDTDNQLGGGLPSAPSCPAPSLCVIERQNANGETSSNDNALAADDHGAVVIAVVKDPAQLLRERGLAFHGDVIDVLTDLIVEAMEKDGQASD